MSKAEYGVDRGFEQSVRGEVGGSPHLAVACFKAGMERTSPIIRLTHLAEEGDELHEVRIDRLRASDCEELGRIGEVAAGEEGAFGLDNFGDLVVKHGPFEGR